MNAELIVELPTSVIDPATIVAGSRPQLIGNPYLPRDLIPYITQFFNVAAE